MFKLNKDVLFLLFKELQDDSKSLFSCLMVNRLWCETIIPILWRNPWRYNIDYNKKSYLFYIITFYFTEDVKDFLRIQGIELPLNSCQSLLFDYLSFCRSINVSIINNIISIGAPSAYDEFLLQQEIYSLLIRKCPELKYLDMIKIKHQLFYFPKANIRLDSLCELRCDTIIDSSYYYGLACVCQNIQRLIIINTSSKDNHGIVKLIEIQKNLKYFEWKDDFKEECFIDPYEVIFPILTKKANTLNHLIIVFEYFEYEHAFLLKVLPELHNLKTLIIDDLELNNIQLKKLIYRNLETIKIDYITINTATCIIKNSGGHLREILLKYYYSLDEGYFNEDSLIFIRTVYENCPLVESLSIVISSTDDHFIEFEKLLKNCKNLKSILLILNHNDVICNELKSNEADEELLDILIRSAPTYLKEIRFLDHFSFSLEKLEAFLIKWRGRPALSIITSDHVYKEENYVKLINKYKNDGVIKNFNRVYKLNVYF
ncbi:uncharacterized protein OCT59_010146 [Rhizophagus irregularis]|uniref:F-box domain-containing protein n=1 Tax=Rhizophagus irregularis (strain DAOM 197198w) TaxID=1432141 RepID=A0A015IKL9_RHIIW|nr:hypothetical protein RirG_204700 [Rhizophagus irregularis DAOM 197198w]UZO18838.1 hypothetical protein OCT59_010146 [Rhizophagus irregularis]